MAVARWAGVRLSQAERGHGTTGAARINQRFLSGFDKLDLKALGGYVFIGEADFTGAKQLQVERVVGGTVLYGNTDLNPETVEFSIMLVGVTSTSQDDLIL